ncbi:MAG: hypothetical protein GY853_10740 [PVC group bacterium]|nr:hypothetical protein [PVC group bacterium]
MEKIKGVVSNIQPERVFGRYGIRWYKHGFIVNTMPVFITLADTPLINDGDQVIAIGKISSHKNTKILNAYAFYNYTNKTYGKGHVFWECFVGFLLAFVGICTIIFLVGFVFLPFAFLSFLNAWKNQKALGILRQEILK